MYHIEKFQRIGSGYCYGWGPADGIGTRTYKMAAGASRAIRRQLDDCRLYRVCEGSWDERDDDIATYNPAPDGFSYKTHSFE